MSGSTHLYHGRIYDVSINWGKTPWSWAGKAYREISEIGEIEGSILVIRVGSIEEYGHHIPVGTDTILVDASRASRSQTGP